MRSKALLYTLLAKRIFRVTGKTNKNVSRETFSLS